MISGRRAPAIVQVKTLLKEKSPASAKVESRVGKEGVEGRADKIKRKQGDTVMPSRQIRLVNRLKENANQGKGVNGRLEEMQRGDEEGKRDKVCVCVVGV